MDLLLSKETQVYYGEAWTDWLIIVAHIEMGDRPIFKIYFLCGFSDQNNGYTLYFDIPDQKQ